MKLVTKDIIFYLKAGVLVHGALSYHWIFQGNVTNIAYRNATLATVLCNCFSTNLGFSSSFIGVFCLFLF